MSLRTVQSLWGPIQHSESQTEPAPRPAARSSCARFVLIALVPLMTTLTGCSHLGTDFFKTDLFEPKIGLPTDWKAGRDADPQTWKQATPSDTSPKSNWWSVFGDDTLNTLQTRALQESPSLQAALARYDQSVALLNARSAARYPAVQAGFAGSRTRTSAERPAATAGGTVLSTVQNDFKPTLNVAYEFDWLGKVRMDIEGAKASSQQAQADADNLRLLLNAQIASVYFQLRQSDEESALLTQLGQAQEKVLHLITQREAMGASSKADLSQQAALVESTQAQLALLKRQRSLLENALATLTGIPAPTLQLPPATLPNSMPSTPVSQPSQVLQRRPDVAAAQRAMAAANAQIGVAQAAFYPSLTIGSSFAGFEATDIAKVFSAPAMIWSLGIAATQPLFDGGRNSALLDLAKAGYTASVANYRLTVLTALQETQDALDSLGALEQAQRRQTAAVAQQTRAHDIAVARYREGLDSGLTLAIAQQNLLIAQRTQSQIKGAQFQAAVALIKALGGGWQAP